MLNKYHFVGKLTLSSRIDKMDYLMVSKKDHDFLSNNLTNILDEVYHSPSPFISIMIRTLDNSTQLIHNGELNISKDKYGIYDWCIDNFALGLELFHLTGKEIEITIKHLERKEIKILEEVS